VGSQTFSKSRVQYPVGISPLFMNKAKGCYSWDLDGNKYIDLVSSLASITLGYGDPKIGTAVRRQLRRGVSLSLPGILEAEVAEQLRELVPSAEMIRFAKNGSDATSAAVRLARAYTGRDHVAICGYHGWQDWFIGSTSRNKGVPAQVSALTHKFQYNDIDSLELLIQTLPPLACVIMEPMNVEYPKEGYLEKVRAITRKYGIILVFDETITGFRFDRGGAQKLFGVIPDLSTFGKGIANGFPLSAIVGKREIMMEMEQIFFSGTFGGELLSLAAAKVVLTKHLRNEITPRLIEIGEELNGGIERILESSTKFNFLSLSGHPTWKFLNWNDSGDYKKDSIKTYFQQELYRKGILVLNSHNVTLALNSRNIRKVINIYEDTIQATSTALENRELQKLLLVEPNEPLFRVR
jgi:glutamate-1-semialdehyde 2,1-aminomutase